MSTAYATIPKQGLEITRIIAGVSDRYYEEMGAIIDGLTGRTVERSGSEYEEGRFVVSNFIYLIHERVQLNIVREINYEQIKTWANQNMKLASYLLLEQWPKFPMEAFEKWVSPDIDLLSCGMYSRSNRFTKNTYH